MKLLNTNSSPFHFCLIVHQFNIKQILKQKLGVYYWTYADNFNFENHFIELDIKIKSYDELYEFME